MPVRFNTYPSAHHVGKSDPNCLDIGLINNMPDSALQATERQFLELLEAAALGMMVRLTPFALPEVPRADAGRCHLNSYFSINDLWNRSLDGVIVTGMEPCAVNLVEEPYWPTFTRLMDWAEENTTSSIWSCLAAHAAAAVQVRVLDGAHDLPGAHLLDVVSIMDTLRVSCPWDKEQTHASLIRYLLEEAYEAVETVEEGDLGALREELGDVMFQVVFHSRVAAERAPEDGGFTIDEVADALAAKLVRRHPHVFGSVAVSSAADVNRNWEEIKKAERAERAGAAGADLPSVLDGVAFGQPALSLAAQLQRRAEREGMPGISGAVEADESAGIGEELMRVVAQARSAGLDPELELRAAARRLAERIRSWERSAG